MTFSDGGCERGRNRRKLSLYDFRGGFSGGNHRHREGLAVRVALVYPQAVVLSDHCAFVVVVSETDVFELDLIDRRIK